jgi:magnesium chelatase family protein
MDPCYYEGVKLTESDLPTLDRTAVAILRSAVGQLNLSARMYARVLIVARSFADWARAERIEPWHLLDAIQYCTLGGEG